MSVSRGPLWLLPLAGILLAAVLGDQVLAPRLLPPPGYFVKPPGEVWRQEAGDGVLPGVHGTAEMHFRADGLRADPDDPADRYRILCIGGSTTECAVLDTGETWPHLLQDRLRSAAPQLHAWVGSAGGSGHNSRQHILVMEHVVARMPACDMVIHLAGVNDFMHRIATDEAFVPLTPEQVFTDGESLDRAFWLHPTKERYLPWFKQTNTWRLGRQAKKALAARRAAPGVANLTRFDYATQLAQVQEHRQTAMRERTVLPDLTSALAEYERNLRYLIGQARAQQRRVMFLTQPTLWRAGLTDVERYRLVFGHVGRDPLLATEYYAPETLAEGMERYNAVTRRVCAAEGVECLDLAAVIPKELTSFYDDCHFNEPGAVQVADAVAEYLLAQPPFGRSEELPLSVRGVGAGG